MKPRKTMIYIINNILLVYILFSTTSCKSQIVNDSVDCKDYYDFYGQLYKRDCFCNKELKTSFYFDLKGNKIEVCGNPDKHGIIFNNSDSLFNDFVVKNLERPICEGEGKFYVILFIDDKGLVVEKRTLRSIAGCIGINEAIMHFLEKLPKWKPAIKNGKNVNSIKILSI